MEILAAAATVLLIVFHTITPVIENTTKPGEDKAGRIIP